MSVKIVAIMGSRRIGGNTDVMLGWVMEGAREAGAEVETVVLRGKTVAQCMGCDTCAKPPYKCIHRDDVDSIQPLLQDAQAIVLATPVYWWGPSGLLKTFVDRWYGFRGERKGTVRGKDFGLVVVCGDPDPAIARHVIGMYQFAADYLDSTLHEPVVAAGFSKPGEVAGDPDVKAKCVELGRKLYLASTKRQG